MRSIFEKYENHFYNSVKIYGVAGIFFGLALCSFLSFLSFDPYDASWFFISSEPKPLSNLCGFIGAHYSAFLFYLFGGAAWLLVPFFAFVGYKILRRQGLTQEWDRLAAVGLMVISVATLHFAYQIEIMSLVYPGGLVGRLFYNVFHFIFDETLMLAWWHTMLFMSIILVTRCSFVTLAHYVVDYSTRVFNRKTMMQSYALIRTLSRIVADNVNKAYIWACRLLDGSILERTNQTILEFEFEDVVQEVFDDVKDDAFWRGTHQSQNQSIGILVDKELPAPVSQLSASHVNVLIDEGPTLAREHVIKKQLYTVPPVELFKGQQENKTTKKEELTLQERAQTLEQKLACFGIVGTVTSIKPGPVITLFEYEPDIDAKVSKILALEDDLALALEAMSVRIIAPIPGRSVVGFEVANKKRKIVYLSQVLRDASFKDFNGNLPLALGHDTVGKNIIVDLVSMPHLLVAGSTGSGKSVALNTMLVSLLCNKDPEQLKLILIDPKRLEFASYSDIAHLVVPIVTDPKKAVPVLRWVVKTMEERYELLASVGMRSILDYQVLCSKRKDLEPMPFLVVIIDELSDLMMTAGKEVEELIARIAQMARAAGIHMIVATQRPSVDVITGLIKVNFPSRISFRVTSKVDSRTILDDTGAEKLLGKGDMLFLNSSSRLQRVHGAYVSSEEIDMLVDYIRKQQEVSYINLDEEMPKKNEMLDEKDDALYADVVSYLQTIDEVSISLLQRRFRIGYNRSARIIEVLEAEGLILPSDGGKTRKVIH